jgi:hypothetical protein
VPVRYGEAVSDDSVTVHPSLSELASPEDAAAVLDTVVRVAPFGFALVGLDHRYLVVNDRLAVMNGATVEAHIGRHIADVVPDLATRAVDLLTTVASTGQPILDVEMACESPAGSGRRRVRSESFHRIATGDGRIVGVAVIARDVTDDRTLRGHRGAQQLARLADAAPEPVLVLSRIDAASPDDFWIEHANESALGSLAGAVASTDVVGRRLYSVFDWLASVGLHDRFADVLATGQPFSSTALEYPPELAARGRDGRFDVSISRSGGYLVVSWHDSTAELRREEPRTRLDVERARIERMQAAFLPRQLPDMVGIELGSAYRAAGGGVAIGGDWYDAVGTSDGVAFCIGDVAGHGIDAVETMAVARVAWRAYADDDPEPTRLLERLSRFVHAQALRQRTDHLVTALSAHYDARTRAVTWATAGHLPPLVVDGAGNARVLTGQPAPPLGVHPGTFELHRSTLAPGATIVLYTDGLIERRGEHIDDSIARLCRIAASLPATPPALCTQLVDRMARTGHVDDVCVLALRAG